MGIFDIESGVNGIFLEKIGFERITKNTWRLNTSSRGANDTRWWSLPVTIDYDVKRKMFRKDFKQRYFVEDHMDFDIMFKRLISGTMYEYYSFEKLYYTS